MTLHVTNLRAAPSDADCKAYCDTSAMIDATLFTYFTLQAALLKIPGKGRGQIQPFWLGLRA